MLLSTYRHTVSYSFFFSEPLRPVYDCAHTLTPFMHTLRLIRVRARFGEKLRLERRRACMRAHTRAADWQSFRKKADRLLYLTTPL